MFSKLAAAVADATGDQLDPSLVTGWASHTKHVDSASPPTVDQQLLAAAVQGDVAEVVHLVWSGADPQATHESDQRTALHAAAEHGQVEVVQRLVELGWQLEACTADGSTALHLAAESGQADAAAMLVAYGAHLEAADSLGITPLQLAVEEGHTAVMEVLLEAGANTEAADMDRRTPLQLAAKYGQQQAAALLLASGADVDSEDSYGYTALHHSSEGGHLSLVRLLLGAQACVERINYGHHTPLYLACLCDCKEVVQELLAAGADPTFQDPDGNTCLHVASVCNHLGVAQHLLQHGGGLSGLNVLNYAGQTPVFMASYRGHRDMVSLLLDSGADVNAGTGAAPIHAAVEQQHLAVVKVLLQAGADPCAALEGGYTVLHLAARGGDLAIMQQLLTALNEGQGRGGVDVVACGRTPLHEALEYDQHLCLEALVAAGADVSKPYGPGAGGHLAGLSPMHKAVFMCQKDAVPLLATPSNLRATWGGDTPLHLALRLECSGMVLALLAAGAPACLVNDNGASAMHLAGASSNPTLQALLPAIIRNECKQGQLLKQPGREALPPQTQQEEGEERGPDALLAEAASSMYLLLRNAGMSEWRKQGVACFKAVLEVLGAPAACSLLQLVLCECTNSAVEVPCSGQLLEVLRAVHTEWLSALEPLTQQRRRLTTRLHYLVTLPLQQQADEAGGKREDGTAMVTAAGAVLGGQSSGGWQQAHSDWQTLWSQAESAAAAGQWQVVVQRLEVLTALQPAPATPLLYTLATGAGSDPAQAVAGLCEALVNAWCAVQQQAATRARVEAAEGVVGAVQAWATQQVRAGAKPNRC